MNKEAQCSLCPSNHCIESNSKLGKVRVEIDNKTKAVIDVKKELIADCPIKQNIDEASWNILNQIK